MSKKSLTFKQAMKKVAKGYAVSDIKGDYVTRTILSFDRFNIYDFDKAITVLATAAPEVFRIRFYDCCVEIYLDDFMDVLNCKTTKWHIEEGVPRLMSFQEAMEESEPFHKFGFPDKIIDPADMQRKFSQDEMQMEPLGNFPDRDFVNAALYAENVQPLVDKERKAIEDKKNKADNTDE